MALSLIFPIFFPDTPLISENVQAYDFENWQSYVCGRETGRDKNKRREQL
jgi:hypothetical protein